MHVAINPEMCEGHASCVLMCPEVFALSADGYGEVINANPGPELHGSASSAAENCPEMAITITE